MSCAGCQRRNVEGISIVFGDEMQCVDKLKLCAKNKHRNFLLDPIISGWGHFYKMWRSGAVANINGCLRTLFLIIMSVAWSYWRHYTMQHVVAHCIAKSQQEGKVAKMYSYDSGGNGDYTVHLAIEKKSFGQRIRTALLW